MAKLEDRLVVTIEVDDQQVRAVADQVAAEYAQAFEARIRKIVHDAMREREVRLIRR